MSEPVWERLPKDGDELQAMLNEAYRKGNDDAHAAHAVMQSAQLEAQPSAAVVVPELTDEDRAALVCEVYDNYANEPASYMEVAYKLAISRIRPLLADRVLGKGQVAVDRGLLDEICEHVENLTQRFGAPGHGDGPGRKADADSHGADGALDRIRDAIRARSQAGEVE